MTISIMTISEIDDNKWMSERRLNCSRYDETPRPNSLQYDRLFRQHTKAGVYNVQVAGAFAS